jgi:hypothetical protein
LYDNIVRLKAFFPLLEATRLAELEAANRLLEASNRLAELEASNRLAELEASNRLAETQLKIINGFVYILKLLLRCLSIMLLCVVN